MHIFQRLSARAPCNKRMHVTAITAATNSIAAVLESVEMTARDLRFVSCEAFCRVRQVTNSSSVTIISSTLRLKISSPQSL